MAQGRRLPPSRPTATAASVTRKVDASGNVCSPARPTGSARSTGAGRCRWPWWVTRSRSRSATELIRSHKVRHDRTREHGALANPGGRAHRINAA